MIHILSLSLLVFLSVIASASDRPIVVADCPGRDLSAFKMSSVFFNGQKVKPFLLTTRETKYIPCSGQPILSHPEEGKIWVGVETENKEGEKTIHKVEYNELLQKSKDYAKTSPGARLQHPKVLGQNQKYLHDGDSKQLTLDLIYNFNNTRPSCDKINSSSFRLRTILENWKSFCSEVSFKQACQKAMEVDMLSRTIAFEAHPLGWLDNIEEPKDVLELPLSNFRTSTCERAYIGVTLRNRKYVGSLALAEDDGADTHGTLEMINQKITRKELLAYSPYFYQGLDGRKYNIWHNKYVKGSFIAACFPEEFRFDKNATEKDIYKYKIFRKSYLDTLAHMYDVLFNASSFDRKISYVSSQSRREEPVHNSIRHYYHPRAMGRCYYKDDGSSWSAPRQARGSIACRELNIRGRKITDCVLAKNEPHRVHSQTGEIQWVHADKHDRNLKYNWVAGDESPWFLRKTTGTFALHLYQKIDNEKGHAYSSMNRRRARYCESFQNEDSAIGNLAPDWALKNGTPRLYTIQCQLNGGPMVKLGGLDDPRIAPVVTRE